MSASLHSRHSSDYICSLALHPLPEHLQVIPAVNSLKQDTRVAVNLEGRYLLVTGYRRSISGLVGLQSSVEFLEHALQASLQQEWRRVAVYNLGKA